MTPLSIAVEPEAEDDLLEAFEWYLKRRDGLGHEFIECVDDAFERISKNAEQFAVCYRNARQALVRRFPYVVVFVVEAKEASIIAVFHGRRDPRQWQARLS